MRFEIMGPLRVVDGGETYTIGARKIEILLTVLLVRADSVVPAGELMKEIWGDVPPRRASAGLHVYISHVRKFLQRPGRDGGPVSTRSPGYVLQLGSDELDSRRFEQLMQQGRAHARAGRHEPAAADFEQALALWRGPQLDECHGPVLQGFQTWLREARLECLEMLVESRLALGRHRETVNDLVRLTTEHPLRETFHQQLMLTLHRCGRRADALRQYQVARRLLDEELGLPPCRALQELHQAILTADDDRLEPWSGPGQPVLSRG
ncbi:MAG: hypothetical protein AVDCRST_MAG41-80 [uncultured Corynebacteriales bacterium]|uniref:OmpR/PhoB-type domain-containing protein n=1 Tax=uncultured Mycobacteriales bacterium TaxID=581187 RepID=A0A6J4H3P4_9ACTN|nr:MAG: hypothetical protein AVDCRST_MAG41-80 [uncultured Corynebacteriales bacterium]